MTQSQHAQPVAPELTGMWAPYVPPEIGEKFDELQKVGQFVLVGVEVREGVPTREYGPKDVADLRVATTDPTCTRLFSGFSKGIVGQAHRIQPGNLPAVCRIIDVPQANGVTKGLELIQLLPPGADVGAVARAQAVPLTPVAADPDIPY